MKAHSHRYSEKSAPFEEERGAWSSRQGAGRRAQGAEQPTAYEVPSYALRPAPCALPATSCTKAHLFLLPFFLLLALASPLAAQNPTLAWQAMVSGHTNNAVFFSSPTHGLAVGTGGAAQFTTDSGLTWVANYSGTPESLNGVWSASPTQHWAVGTAGVIVFGDGQSWTAQDSATTQVLHAVWGAAANDVWAVGAAGTIRHFNGAAWETVASPTTSTLLGIHGTSATDIWASGEGGTLLHFDGVSWTTQTSGTTAHLHNVYARTAASVWASGNSGTVLEYDGSSWTAHTTGTTGQLRAILALSASDVWVTGDVTRRFNGSSWATAARAGNQDLHLAPGGSVWTAGNNNEIKQADGAGAWTTRSYSAGNHFAGIHSPSAGNVFLTGNNGRFDYTTGSAWTRTIQGVLHYEESWGTSATNLWVCGSAGSIRYWNGTTLTAQTTGTTQILYGIWGTDSANIWAVGIGGTILKYNGSTWSAQASGTGATLRDVHGTSATNIWAVGDAGTILRYDGTTWAPVSSGTTNHLYGVHATSTSDAWAVGTFGTARKWNGTAWSTIPTNTSQTLGAVFALNANTAWLVGGAGTIRQWNGTTLLSRNSGTGTRLTDVFATSNTDVWIAGENGTLLSSIVLTDPPTITSLAATAVLPTSATLNADIRPNGAQTTAYFEYGPTTSYGSTTAPASLSPDAANTIRHLSSSISGLTARTTYHFRVVATSDAGTTHSNDAVFNTENTAPSAPSLASNDTIPENSAAGTLIDSLGSVFDADGDPITYSLVSGPGDNDNARYTVSANRQLRSASPFDYEAISYHSVRVRASDGFTSADAVLTIHITNVNEAPTANAIALPASSTVAISPSGSDPDLPAQTLSFSIASLPTQGTLKDNGTTISSVPHSLSGSLTYTKNAGASSTSDSFTYTAFDGALSSAPAAVTLSIQGDADGDGIPDSQETGDSDGDGIPDSQESNTADLNGDGFIDALVATVHTVTTTADSGAGSLRAAIVAANASSTADGIRFSIPNSDSGHLQYNNDSVPASVTLSQAQPVSAGGTIDPDWNSTWFRISLTSPLPALSGPVTISGYTQSGSLENSAEAPAALSTRLRIQLHGNSSTGSGFQIKSPNCTIRGIAITGFTSTTGWTGAGVLIGDQSDPAMGNIPNAKVEGCFLGTDISGTRAIGSRYGIIMHGAAKTTGAILGGTAPASRNLISGNTQLDLSLYGSYVHVRGNLIGTERTGTAKLRSISNAMWIGEDYVTIGGTLPGSVNVIAPCLETVHVPDNAAFLTVQGNLIGLAPDGHTLISNRPALTRGITPRHALDSLIGGTTTAARNVLGGFTTAILIPANGASERVTIQGNLIGISADNIPLPNTTGIEISEGFGHVIGGTTAAAENTILHNTTAILGTGATTNFAVLRNVIHSNTTALSLPATHNDAGDEDSGTNGLLNYPILLTALQDGSTTQLHIALDAPAGTYRLDVYDNATTASATTFSQAEQHLGSKTLTLSSRGRTAFTVPMANTTFSAEYHLSATLTLLDSAGAPVATSSLGGFDSDSDSVMDLVDLDDDNDGLPDVDETSADTDLDGLPNHLDLDSDNDGINDIREAGGTDADGSGTADGTPNSDGIIGSPLGAIDTDGDAQPDFLDLDSDNDTVSDVVEGTNHRQDLDDNGVLDGADTDGDGIRDSIDLVSHLFGELNDAQPTETMLQDEDTIPDYLDLDYDQDNVSDIRENGHGLLDTAGSGNITDATDSDHDGIADVIDSLPGFFGGIANLDLDGDGILNVDDPDVDGDGIVNILDGDLDGDGLFYEDDPTQSGPGTLDDLDNDTVPNADDDDIDGDLILNADDLDLDGDGIVNALDSDVDGDGIANGSDPDADQDGFLNADDANPLGLGTTDDLDNDTIPNSDDHDIDGDGIVNFLDADVDGDGVLNAADNDADSDLLPDSLDSAPRGLGLVDDLDSDGLNNQIDTDIDGDGLENIDDNDADGDGLPNHSDIDDDQDGIADMADSPLPINDAEEGQNTLLPNPDLDADGIVNVYDEDTDGDGTLNVDDEDDDNDATPDIDDSSPTGPGTLADLDGDGILNENDPDIDGDDVINLVDLDVDGDGIPNEFDTDSDSDGIPDADDTSALGIGAFGDHDGDGIPNDQDHDIDADGVVNYYDIDTDGDGVDNLTSTDDDADGIPDTDDTTPNGVGTRLDLDADGLINSADTDMDGDSTDNSSDPDANGDGLPDPTNTAPVVRPTAYSVIQGTTRAVPVSATDSDIPQQAVTVFITTLPVQGTLVDGSTTLTAGNLPHIISGTLTYTADSSATGADSFSIAADDGLATSVEVSIPLTILAPSSPVAWRVEFSGRANNSLHMVSATHGFAVGASGQLRRTTNGGTTWLYDTVTPAIASDLHGVWAFNSTNAWAVGANGTILRWNGLTWSAQTSPTTATLLSVWGTALNNVYATGSNGTLLRYNGVSWSALNSTTSQDLHSIWGTDAANMWMVGSAGTILRTSGTSWVSQSSPTTVTLRAIHGSDSSNVWAVGDSGTVLKYNGTAWSTQSTPTTGSLHSVYAVSSSAVWATGPNVTLYHNGTSWLTAPTGTCNDVHATPDGKVWTAGINNQIKKWTGLAWATQSVHQAQPLQSIAFTASSQEGIIAAHGGRIDLSSPDGNWARTASGINVYSDGWRADTTNAWIVGASGVIKHLVNDAWLHQTSGTPHHLYGIWGTDSSNIWAVGDGGTILKYDGSSWSPQSSGVATTLRDIHGTDSSNIWATGDAGTILHFDGTAWTTFPSGTTTQLNAIFALDQGEAWAVGQNGVVRRYNGSQWLAQGAPLPTHLSGIKGTDVANIWIVGSNGRIWHWNGLQFLSEVSHITMPIHDVAASTSSEIWAVAEHGTLLSTRVTAAGAPTASVTTLAATTITSSEATLNGTLNSNGQFTLAEFQYGTTAALGTSVPLSLTDASGTTDQAVSHTLADLRPGTTYHFRLVATTEGGTQSGGTLTFYTIDPDSYDVDGDGIPNPLDADLDGDGIPNGSDADADGDGIPNGSDPTPFGIGTSGDHDGDGIANADEGDALIDTDGDGLADSQDPDSDNDTLSDSTEAGSTLPFRDSDLDGIPDLRDLDSDNDGINDIREGTSTDADNNGLADSKNLTAPQRDTDADGVSDERDLDSDADTFSDLVESGLSASADPDRNGILSGPDSDSDGILDLVDSAPSTFGESADPLPQNTDGDSEPNHRDLDSDNDSLTDLAEAQRSYLDTNGDGRHTTADTPSAVDSDGDGIPDTIDAAPGHPGGLSPTLDNTYTLWRSAKGLGNTSNSDGDAYDDLLEFALGLDPATGASSHTARTTESALPRILADQSGQPTLRFIRTPGQLQLGLALQTTPEDGTTWTTTSLDPLPSGVTLTATANGDGTETVSISGLSSLIHTTENSGILRVLFTNTSPSLTATTPPIGWCRTELNGKMQSIGTAHLLPPLYSATIASTTASSVTLSTTPAAGSITLPAYLEVQTGPQAGQRIDISSSEGATVQLNLAAAHNTTSTMPSGLVGQRIVIRPHHTLSQLLPLSLLSTGTLNPTTADQALVWNGSGFTTYYHLSDGAATAYWARTGDSSFSNQNSTLLPPGTGLFVKHPLPSDSATTLLTGDLRTHSYRQRLSQGDNLISLGQPHAHSPAQLGMTRANGFTGTLNPQTADQLLLWNGDTTTNSPGYTTYYLLHNGGPTANEQWTRTGDNSFTNHNNTDLLLPCRAHFLRVRSPAGATLTHPSPLAP